MISTSDVVERPKGRSDRIRQPFQSLNIPLPHDPVLFNSKVSQCSLEAVAVCSTKSRILNMSCGSIRIPRSKSAMNHKPYAVLYLSMARALMRILTAMVQPWWASPQRLLHAVHIRIRAVGNPLAPTLAMKVCSKMVGIELHASWYLFRELITPLSYHRRRCVP